MKSITGATDNSVNGCNVEVTNIISCAMENKIIVKFKISVNIRI